MKRDLLYPGRMDVLACKMSCYSLMYWTVGGQGYKGKLHQLRPLDAFGASKGMALRQQRLVAVFEQMLAFNLIVLYPFCAQSKIYALWRQARMNVLLCHVQQFESYSGVPILKLTHEWYQQRGREHRTTGNHHTAALKGC